MLAVAVLLLRRSGIVPRRPSLAFLRSGAWFGARAHVGNVVHKLGLRVDMFVLGYMVAPDMLGVYAVMTAVAEALWILADSVAAVMLTALSRVEDARSAAARAAAACRVTFTASIVGVACAAALAPYVVPAFYGAAYAVGLRAFNCLLPGVVFMSGCKVLSKYWASRNRPEVLSLTASVATVVSAVGCMVLIPRHGIVGAAMASSAAYGVRFVLDVCMFIVFAREGGPNLIMVTRRDLRGVVGH
jgi:O-antigen/teichoic acid export membrane protein